MKFQWSRTAIRDHQYSQCFVIGPLLRTPWLGWHEWCTNSHYKHKPRINKILANILESNVEGMCVQDRLTPLPPQKFEPPLLDASLKCIFIQWEVAYVIELSASIWSPARLLIGYKCISYSCSGGGGGVKYGETPLCLWEATVACCGLMCKKGLRLCRPKRLNPPCWIRAWNAFLFNAKLRRSSK